jgi:hypothetical protein
MNFEMRGDIEPVTSSTNELQAGIVMGLPNLHARAWHAFRLVQSQEAGSTISFSSAWTDQQVTQPVALKPGRNAFEFQFRDGRATASVNGTEVLQGIRPPRSSARISTDEFLVGLGASNNGTETTLRYHHIQIRRLAPDNPAR